MFKLVACLQSHIHIIHMYIVLMYGQSSGLPDQALNQPEIQARHDACADLQYTTAVKDLSDFLESATSTCATASNKPI